MTSSLPGGTVGQDYSAALSATGGVTPYTWTIAGGNLPSGLTLSSAGTISGSLKSAGTSDFMVKVTGADGKNDNDTQALSIVVSSAVSITTSSLPGGQVGVAYSQTLQVSGGTAPYTWSISGGSLPQGLSLSANGQISGTPSSAGTASFTAKAVDKNSASATQSLSITISPGPVSITTTSLLGGQVGNPYAQTLQASGGTGTYTWSIASGSLPSGLNLSGSGQISGTPTAPGNASFTVKAADTGSGSATRALSINIAGSPVSITTASVPAGQVGVPYSQTLQASGGTGSFTWTISSGSLPAGLNLSAAGQIAGTPTTSGTSSFTVKVTDTASRSASVALSINVAAAVVPVSITTTSLPNGEAGVPYSQTLQASGGTAPYSWSISSGALPLGLSLSAGGQIVGTPAGGSSVSFTARVSDSAGASATGSFAFTIAANLTVAVCAATSGPAGQPYSALLSASGGVPPYTWALAGGQLPPGLAINSSSGQIGGTPSTPGSYSFGVKVSDQGSASVTTTCVVTIGQPLPLGISTSSLPNGLSGISYNQAIAGTGGVPPYTWAIAGGALPSGLGLTGGQISGTPTTTGTFQFTINVTDSTGKTATKAFAIQISAALTLITTSLSPLSTGVSSSQQLSASGGVPPYTWTISAGALPPGIALSSSGAVSGTPTTAGSYGFTVRVTDAAAAVAERAFNVVVTSSLSISSCPASNALQGQSYSSAATGAGGQPPYTWTLAAGTLPTGVQFSASSGGLSGTPADPGVYSYTLLIADKSGATATRNCTLTVSSSLSIPPVSLADASPSSPYSQTLTATGGKAPYTWSIVSGNLPAGLTLSSAGIISGSPTQVGKFSFSVGVADANGAVAQQTFSINVVFGLIISACPANVAEVGLVFNAQMVASGGTPPYIWTLSVGSLPAGLTLDRSSGAISGTPQQAGTVQFTLNAQDANGTANKACSIQVSPALAVANASLSSGISGANYSDTLSSTGGVGPFVWSTTAGSLPPGLSLNAANGEITGTPLVAGTFNFTAKAIDSIGGQATKDLSITIAQGLTIQDCPTPAGVVGLAYSSKLTAVGGTLPYVWKIDSGALPPGLTLSSDNAAISGVPSQVGLSNYVLRVTDASTKSTTRLCSIQINNATLNITTASPLPNGTLGTQYNQTLSATGGRAPYTWSITTGAPPGFVLSAAGVLTGVPTTPGNFTFTVQVTDQDNNVAQQSVTVSVLAGKAPNLTISGLPDIVDPAGQPAFTLSLDSAYPADINGTLTLVFTPDPAVGIDDPAIQFASGGRTLKFTVPSGSTQVAWSAPVVAFQTGTVAGSIQLVVQLISNGTDISPATSTLVTVRVDRLAPRIVSVSVVASAAGYNVQVTGFATTREVTQGSFQFSGDAAGSGVNVAVPLSSASQTWFQNPSSGQFGGQFGLVQSFTWNGQPTSMLNSVSVSLVNAQGTSAAVSAKF